MKQPIRLGGQSVLLAGIFILLVCTTAIATTFIDIEKKCPTCGSMVKGHEPGSTYIAGMSPDFRPLGGIDWTISSLLECKQCGFVSLSYKYDDTTGLDTNKITAVLAELETTTLFSQLDRAIAIERNWQKDPQLLAKLFLAAKWLADDTGEKDLVAQRLADAIAAHEHILNTTKPDMPEETGLIYLIGELNRQAGNEKKALELFLKAEKNAEKDLLPLIRQQRAVTEKHGKQLNLNELAEASDDEKLAAIPYLRERTDPETLAFLQEFCFKCPYDYRERAIDALSGEIPLKHHIPIYLEGLRNDHYRTVQGSAQAVEELQIKEAAPIIADVLTNPVEHTEHLLNYALAATATSNEVEFLTMYSEMETNLLFSTLINTCAENAVPHILNILTKLDEGFYMFDAAYGEEELRKVAEFPELLDALPDLSTAETNNAVAIFKAEVLQFVHGPGVEKQLLAGAKRGGELGNTCALVLSARGNPACKTMLIDGLPKNLDCAHFLYPVLEPEDYEPLYENMQAMKAKLATELKMAGQYLTKPQLDEEAKKFWEQEIEGIEWRQEQLPVKWVEILAATGNPEAKSLCLELLSGTYADTRLIATHALARIYDDQTGTMLINACTREEIPWVAEEMFHVLGEHGNANTADQMMQLMEQPTLASFKLNWLDAMKKLAPEQARPIAKQWTSSPNQQLSTAAREFLE